MAAAPLAQHGGGAADGLWDPDARPDGVIVPRLPDRHVTSLLGSTHDVFGHFKVDGVGPASERGPKGVAHHLRQAMSMAHAGGPHWFTSPFRSSMAIFLEAAALISGR